MLKYQLGLMLCAIATLRPDEPTKGTDPFAHGETVPWTELGVFKAIAARKFATSDRDGTPYFLDDDGPLFAYYLFALDERSIVSLAKGGIESARCVRFTGENVDIVRVERLAEGVFTIVHKIAVLDPKNGIPKSITSKTAFSYDSQPLAEFLAKLSTHSAYVRPTAKERDTYADVNGPDVYLLEYNDGTNLRQSQVTAPEYLLKTSSSQPSLAVNTEYLQAILSLYAAFKQVAAQCERAMPAQRPGGTKKE